MQIKGCLARVIAVSFISIGAQSTQAGTVTWTGGAGTNNWHTAGNWIDDMAVQRVPGNLDDVVLANVGPSPDITFSTGTLTINTINGPKPLSISGGTLNVGDAITDLSSIASLTLSSTLGGAGELTITGSLSWASGGMSGTGKTILGAGVTTTISGNSPRTLQRQLDNNGIVNWTGVGQLLFTSATLNNFGTFNVVAASFTSGSGNSLFVNAGTFNANAAGTVQISLVAFRNDGLVNVDGGTLRFDDLRNNGTIEVDASTTLLIFGGVGPHAANSLLNGAGTIDFWAGTHTFPAGTFTPTGPVNFTGGTITVNNTITPSSLGTIAGVANFNAPQTFSIDVTLTNQIGGSGDVTIASPATFTWASGAMSGTGKTILGAGVTTTMSGNSPRTLQRQLDNNGVIDFTMANTCVFSNGTLNNFGSINASIESSSSFSFSGGTINLFRNNGNFTKTGLGIFSTAVPVQNEGTLDIQSGTISLQGSFAQSAGTTWLNGGGIGIPSVDLSFQGGVLKGQGNIGTNVNNQGAEVAPGNFVNETGVISITGNYTQGAGGQFTMEIAGTAPGSTYDQLLVSGRATLAGTLSIVRVGGYVPNVGNQFTALTYGGPDPKRVGYFCNLVGLQIGPSLWFDRLYESDRLKLVVKDTPPVLDCNNLGGLDECETFNNPSLDCDQDTVPDSCQLAGNDCNGNNVLDVCEVGACKLPDGTCTTILGLTCRAQDGLFCGPCGACPSQQTFHVVERSGGVFAHVIKRPLYCPGFGGRTARDCPSGGLYIDTWESPADGEMCHNFSQNPIPAGFFASGSEAYSGSVCLDGEPLGPTQWGDFGEADTLVSRTADPFDRCAFASPAESTVAIEVVALSLKSTAPITVMVNGAPENWSVTVDLSGAVPPPPSGSLTATKTHCNGGTYTSILNVQPRFTFTKVADPGQVRVLDTGMEGQPAVQLIQDTAMQWVSELDPLLGVSGDPCTHFHAGISEPNPTTSCDCNNNGVNDWCDPDCDANGIPNVCEPAYNSISTFLAQLLISNPSPNLVCLYDRNADGMLNGLDIAYFIDDLLP